MIKSSSMEKLPAIRDKVTKRPYFVDEKNKQQVPNMEYDEFWLAFYQLLRKKLNIQKPIENLSEENINPYFGYFGKRFHPTEYLPYFHVGLDISGKAKTQVRPILDGQLEYSGFHTINGNYVYLSHPEVVTEDGYKMHTIYMHLKTTKVSFSAYQKMLRQISFNSYPNIPISKDTILGEMGSSGNVEGLHVHLHLQVEFKKGDNESIMIDPAELLGFNPIKNLTAEIGSLDQFSELYKIEKDAIEKYQVKNYWEKVLNQK